MLSENEKKWLADRQCVILFSCLHCDKHGNRLCPLKYVDGYCMKKPDYEDAAVFESLVAEKLAHAVCYASDECYNNPKLPTCTECGMKQVRLMVEEEMQ